MNDELLDSLNVNDTRMKIFKAAAHLFAEKGYNGVSMREISEMTGISKPMIYYYFKNKEGIYTSLMEVSLHYNTEKFRQLIQKNISAKQKIIELIKIRFQQVLEYPELAKFFMILMTGTEKLPFLQFLMDEATERRKLLVDLIREGVNSGEFGTTVQSELATEIFVGTMVHFMIKQLNTQEIFLTDQLAEEIVEILFKGLNE
jgi:TetR/AcrR family transcriptional regulator